MKMRIHLLFSIALLALTSCNQAPDRPQDDEDFSERRAPAENALAQSGFFADPHNQSPYSFSPYGAKGISVTNASNSTSLPFGNLTNSSTNTTGSSNNNLVDMFKTIFGGNQSPPAGNTTQSPASSGSQPSATAPISAGHGSSTGDTYYEAAQPIAQNTHEVTNKDELKMAATDIATSNEVPPLPSMEKLKEESLELPAPELKDVPKQNIPSESSKTKEPIKANNRASKSAPDKIAMNHPKSSPIKSLASEETVEYKVTDGSSLVYQNGQPRFMKILGTL